MENTASDNGFARAACGQYGKLDARLLYESRARYVLWRIVLLVPGQLLGRAGSEAAKHVAHFLVHTHMSY